MLNGAKCANWKSFVLRMFCLQILKAQRVCTIKQRPYTQNDWFH